MRLLKGIVSRSSGVSNKLLDDLLRSYSIDENGDFYDSLDGSSTKRLVRGASATQVAGKLSNAVQLAGDNTTLCAAVLSTDLRFTNTPFTIACFVKAAGVGNVQYVWSKYRSSGGAWRSYRMLILGDGTIFFDVFGDGATSISVNPSTVLVNGTWYHIVCSYDPSTELAVWIDKVKTVNTTSIPASVYDYSGSQFTIGSTFENTQQWGESIVDQLDIAGRVWDSDDVDAHYNDGNGLAFAGFEAGPNSLLTGLLSYYEMDDVSGDRVDKHAAKNLTPTSISNVSDYSVFAPGYLTNADSAHWNQITTELTVIAKVLPDPFAANFRAIVTRYRSFGSERLWDLIQNAAGNLHLRIWEDGAGAFGSLTVESGTAIPDSTWSNVAGVFSGAAYQKVILNGVVVNVTSGVKNDVDTNTQALWVGRLNEGAITANFWDGGMKDVAIWNRALSEAEVELAHSLTYGEYQ